MRGPENPADLLIENITYGGWDEDYEDLQRFAVVNGRKLLKFCDLAQEDVRRKIPEAVELARASSWKELSFEWRCSDQTQHPRAFRKPARVNKPMRFDRAAIMILATDLAIQEKGSDPTVSAFDFMKIMAISHYVEGINSDVLAQLRKKGGFIEKFCRKAGQRNRDTHILNDHQKGQTLTRYAASILRAMAINAGVPNVGVVRFADNNSEFNKPAVKHLNVPRTMDARELAENLTYGT